MVQCTVNHHVVAVVVKVDFLQRQNDLVCRE